MDELNIDALIQEYEGNMGKVIGVLQNGRLTDQPKTEKYLKQLDPSKHDIMDNSIREDKKVNVDAESPDYGSCTNIRADYEPSSEKVKIERVARIALAIQKLIVSRAVGITFGNPVKYKCNIEEEDAKKLYNAVMAVLKDNKEQPLNRKVARQVYGITEVAERWYQVEGSEMHKRYSETGTKKKIRCVVFSPMYGDTLYPYFNDERDMVAFSRKFNKTDAEGKKHSFFETYTAERFYMWRTDGEGANGWQLEEGYPTQNPYGKIPIVYGCQERTEFEDVQNLIDRLEKLLSNFADTNDYHASPKIVINGRVKSFCKKGEAGAILELDEGASASYLSWANAPESVKQEYQTLKEMIHTITQTPDISWDSVKGVNVSGVALELMFMDAILKVKDKEEIWLDFLTRRVNIIKAILAKVDQGSFGGEVKNTFIEPEIVPYIITDKQTRANVELALTGNKQLKSQRTAMMELGIDNVDDELEAIKSEESESNMWEQNEPTMA